MNSLICPQRDHERCIESAIESAHTLCAQNGARLTEQREQVLRLVWQSHRPLGAYSLMELLAEATTRPVAPPTVYRALDFLSEQGLVHKIHSLNAFIGCSQPGEQHQSYFLICRQCQNAMECGNTRLAAALTETAASVDFQTEEQSVEIVGVCAPCRRKQA